MVTGAAKFDERRSRNAFGSCTRTAVRAFFGVLRKEEKQASRFVLGESLPEPICFDLPVVVEPVSHIDIERDRRSASPLGHCSGLKRGWAPVEEYEEMVQTLPGASIDLTSPRHNYQTTHPFYLRAILYGTPSGFFGRWAQRELCSQS
jgi:hypothetical protein